jgi:hypothetical protein
MSTITIWKSRLTMYEIMAPLYLNPRWASVACDRARRKAPDARRPPLLRAATAVSKMPCSQEGRTAHIYQPAT